MLYSHHLPYGFLFAVGAIAQSDPEASSSLSDPTILTGVSENSVPTGNYISYESTITRSSTSPTAITTSLLLSIISSDTTTRTRTIGTTTIFGLNGTPLMSSNSSDTRSGSSTTSNSQIVLQGSSRTTSSTNGTSNSTATSTSSTVRPTNTAPCNSYPEFCERSYGNITEVAAHNSPFIRPGNAAANQALDVTTQLNDGIRLLQGQMHFVNETPHFCHSSCEVLDAGPITDYLGKVHDWVLAHPFDVVTLLLGNGAKSDGSYPSVTEYVPFLEDTGLVPFAYQPPQIPMGIDDWPTLASMILSGKRVVIFMDYEANQTAVPYVLDEFSQMWETPFDPTDRSFPCDVQRPPDLPEEAAKNRLYLFNHNLNYDITLFGNSILVPQIPLLNVTNNVTGEGSLGLNTQSCNDTWGYPPKFLNVDYYNIGNGSVFEVAATYNNVTYNRPCCGLPISAGTGTMDLTGRSAMMAAVLVVGISWLLL